VDIQTKDGILLRNIPDGTPDDVIKARIEQIRAGGAPPVQEAKPEPTTAEKVAGHPATRFAAGAGSPVLGLLQLGEKAYGGTAVDDKIKAFDRMSKAGRSSGGAGFALNPVTAPIEMAEALSGADIYGTAGAALNPLGVAASKAIPLAKTVIGRMGQGSAFGGASGVMAPVTGEDYASEKTGQIGTGVGAGALIPGAVTAGAKGIEAIRNFLPGGTAQIASNMANKTAGEKRGEIVRLLTANDPLVAGAKPSAGEVAAPAGGATFSGLQRIVEKRAPDPYSDMEKASESARLATVRTVGQDKPALDAAEATRKANAATNYGTAYGQAIKGDPKLAALAENPYFKDALPTAMKLAEAEGVTPKGDLTRFLHFVKIGLDKQLERVGETALVKTEKDAVMSVRKELIDWLGQKNPAYDAARKQFAADSVPINQMQVGQELEKALVSPLGTAERAGVYANAVREAPKTLKRATSYKRYDDLSDVLDPKQTQSVKDVSSSLARRAEYEDLASRGTSAAADAINLAVPKMPASGMFNPKYSVARAIINRMTGNLDNKALDFLATKMQDPQEMAKLMQLSPPQRKAVIEALLQQGGRYAAIGAAQ
jgi:hypothetical protein